MKRKRKQKRKLTWRIISQTAGTTAATRKRKLQTKWLQLHRQPLLYFTAGSLNSFQLTALVKTLHNNHLIHSQRSFQSIGIKRIKRIKKTSYRAKTWFLHYSKMLPLPHITDVRDWCDFSAQFLRQTREWGGGRWITKEKKEKSHLSSSRALQINCNRVSI